MKNICLLFLLLSVSMAYTQETFQVMDQTTGEPVSFITIRPLDKDPIQADMYGRFQLNIAEITCFEIKYIGYPDTVIEVSALGENRTISLVPETSTFGAENDPEYRIAKAKRPPTEATRRIDIKQP